MQREISTGKLEVDRRQLFYINKHILDYQIWDIGAPRKQLNILEDAVGTIIIDSFSPTVSIIKSTYKEATWTASYKL